MQMTQPASSAKQAVFAGGCFWCMEAPFAELDGVIDVVSGYTGGTVPNPSYKQVCSGTTGHFEAVQVTYDPGRVTYSELLDVFWASIDPTDPGGQFCDRGQQYHPAVFVDGPEQRIIAEISRAALDASGVFAAPVATQILDAKPFYPAEDYHQDYYLQQPERYCAYKQSSGRAGFLHSVWGTEKGAATTYSVPDDAELRSRLSSTQYDVAVRGGTEPPFDNEYWNNKAEGVYVDVVTGQPLFSSQAKYDSGTGWPSFTSPIAPGLLVYTIDSSLGETRVKVSSRLAGTHLGHVFADGPAPHGLRFCMNSSSLRFVPAPTADL
ncbi:MAG: Peptide methionine sulfoxide reductase MsrA/MsrB [Firmicutes bacterium ADurb.Bin506]|jgi:peptide methionine sulfoxide reductase msrA/msrB|nr:MAG: Peptide methionine sulfoxide reductase MsrA/MsrB [Firmicutes bacterium ADurb.Bin506]